jgi:putative transposase
MLADKCAEYKDTGKFGNQTPAQYKDEYPFLKETDSLALANVQMHLNRAISESVGKGKSKSKSKGFPHFKSAKHSRKSYTTNNQNGSISIVGSFIKLPKIGKVKAKIHRLPRQGWILKSATVSEEPDGKFYISVLFEYDIPDIAYTADTSSVIGLDYKSDGLYADSDGNIGSNHKYYRESQKKLARAQRKLSRKKGARKGETPSNNYKKQQLVVAKIHARIANQRKDNLHKLSTGIANRYDIVCVENLNMKAMSNKGFHNGKATLDNGYGMFLELLEYKLTDRGKYFITVDKWYPSSQICCKCGKIHSEMKDLRIRTMACDCSNVMDRDLNSAINIKMEGLRIFIA